MEWFSLLNLDKRQTNLMLTMQYDGKAILHNSTPCIGVSYKIWVVKQLLKILFAISLSITHCGDNLSCKTLTVLRNEETTIDILVNKKWSL